MRRTITVLIIIFLGRFGALAGELDPAIAQNQNRVVVIENVKLDYAQVLSVEPVYQTLRAHWAEEQCNPSLAAPDNTTDRESGLSRMFNSVQGLFAGKKSSAPTPAVPANVRPNDAIKPSRSGGSPSPEACRIVEVPREFRRPIAYDVDYVYKGTKYRSRLPEDPGNRLRVRVSVTPYLPEPALSPKRQTSQTTSRLDH